MQGLDVAETLKATQVWMRDVRELEYVRSFPKEMQVRRSTPSPVPRVADVHIFIQIHLK